ncbi:MAG: tRNA lysidine(34) synthetase TilS [Ectothiorhodospiraceae bacterium]|nr:tRNA lysidine(34) synthetase TilS [Ectothiorhodospiraceae bacterium]MCH8506541.1 tRNA lysidine(34) synthetase TilS [Ectothiorhodospiraceae bacterium]
MMPSVLEPQAIVDWLGRQRGAHGYVVAYSGGVDSHVLLHVLASQAELLPFPLRALHVNHGIHPAADSWAEHCSDVCADLDVPLQVVAVDVSPGPSLEAQARRARYAALEQHLAAGELLLTGHHRDDQVETLLLRALRGAGIDGLAAMPPGRPLGVARLARPLLGVPRAAILAYAEQHRLAWIDDPANADLAHDRNFLRHRVLPPLRQRWPGADQSLAQLAQQARESRFLLEELAIVDGLGRGATVSCDLLRELPDARARNLVRAWLRRLDLPMPPRPRLRQGLHDLLAAGEDRQPELAWPGARLRRFRGLLYADEGGDPPPWTIPVPWDGRPLQLLEAGVLHVQESDGGLDPELLEAGLELAPRRYGERCRPEGRGERQVKKLLQEAGIPPWQRMHWPILRDGNEIVAIPGVCVCEGYGVGEDETGLELRWEPV